MEEWKGEGEVRRQEREESKEEEEQRSPFSRAYSIIDGAVSHLSIVYKGCISMIIRVSSSKGEGKGEGE
jgi:hypothetical protein